MKRGLKNAIYNDMEETMAYKYNWDSDEKPPEKDMISYLTGVVPDLVDSAFLVIAASDDGGRHIVMMAEWEEEGASPWKKDSHQQFDDEQKLLYL